MAGAGAASGFQPAQEQPRQILAHRPPLAERPQLPWCAGQVSGLKPERKPQRAMVGRSEEEPGGAHPAGVVHLQR